MNKQNLHAILKKYYDKGLYTHAFAACGYIDEPEKDVSCFLYGDENRRFDLASLTKALVTTPLLFWALKKENMSLKTTLENFLGEENKNIFSKKILSLRVDELLGHKSGLKDWLCLWVECLDPKENKKLSPLMQFALRLNKSLEEGLSEKGQDRYSDLGFILLGLCLELKYKKNLDELFSDFCLSEFSSIENLSYNTSEKKRNESIKTGYCKIREKELVGEVHDENAGFFGGVCGHAGLFSSGEELVSYLRKLCLTKIGKEILDKNKALRVDNKKMQGLCGWQQGAGESSIVFSQGKSIGHLGFTGTAFWLDPDTLKYGVLLSNRVVSGRVNPTVNNFRKESFAILSSILEES